MIEEKKIDQEQMRRLTRAFEAAGIVDPAAQKALVRTCVFRPFDSMRDLLAKDVRPILQSIEAKSQGTKPVTGSAWDNREGDTWIDKL